jgi:hypothetical protein
MVTPITHHNSVTGSISIVKTCIAQHEVRYLNVNFKNRFRLQLKIDSHSAFRRSYEVEFIDRYLFAIQ